MRQSGDHPFLFIVGCERSGTTLLRAMIASHPHVAIPDESYFIVRLARHRRRYERASGFDVEPFLDDLLRDPNFRRWTISQEDIALALRHRPPTDYADAIRRVFEVHALAQGKSRYGDKTPSYVSHLGNLGDLFGEAVFAHVIRDGREVALSLIERTHERPNHIGEAAIFWRDRVRHGRRAGTQLGGRYLEVRYDDLIGETARTLREVCALARIPCTEADVAQMLGYPAHAEELTTDAVHPPSHVSIRRPPTPGLRDWRNQMGPRDLLVFEAIASSTLRDAGYPLISSKRARLAAQPLATLARLQRAGAAALFIPYLAISRCGEAIRRARSTRCRPAPASDQAVSPPSTTNT